MARQTNARRAPRRSDPTPTRTPAPTRTQAPTRTSTPRTTPTSVYPTPTSTRRAPAASATASPLPTYQPPAPRRQQAARQAPSLSYTPTTRAGTLPTYQGLQGGPSLPFQYQGNQGQTMTFNRPPARPSPGAVAQATVNRFLYPNNYGSPAMQGAGGGLAPGGGYIPPYQVPVETEPDIPKWGEQYTYPGNTWDPSRLEPTLITDRGFVSPSGTGAGDRFTPARPGRVGDNLYGGFRMAPGVHPGMPLGAQQPGPNYSGVIPGIFDTRQPATDYDQWAQYGDDGGYSGGGGDGGGGWGGGGGGWGDSSPQMPDWWYGLTSWRF